MFNKPRILFVDDDENLLKALKRNLISQLDEWDMEFCNRPLDALKVVGKIHFDVIVTDLRMPGMTGVELLQQVCLLSPNTARIILSGHVGEQEIADSIDVSHRFLSKPCNKKVMIETIQTSLSNQEYPDIVGSMLEETITSFNSVKLKELIVPLKSLPVIPTIYTRLLKLLDEPGVNIFSVAQLVEKDPGISSHFLRIANSSYFSLRQQVDSLEKALDIISLPRIRTLILGLNLSDDVTENAEDSKFILDCWEHSLRVGEGARLILQHEGFSKELQSLAFLGGVLHDIGKVTLYLENALFYKQTPPSPRQREWEGKFFGFCHERVGAGLVRLWGLPSSLGDIIKYHHRSEKIIELNPMAAVYFMNQLEQGIYEKGQTYLNDQARTFLEKLNLQERWPVWLSLLQKKGLYPEQSE